LGPVCSSSYTPSFFCDYDDKQVATSRADPEPEPEPEPIGKRRRNPMINNTEDLMRCQ
jgi:hypothetical protein